MPKTNWCVVKGQQLPAAIISTSKRGWGVLSQDVVHGPGSRALRRAGLRVGTAGGVGGHVSQSGRPAAGVRCGETVHDAGEALEAGGSGWFVAQTL